MSSQKWKAGESPLTSKSGLKKGPTTETQNQVISITFLFYLNEKKRKKNQQLVIIIIIIENIDLTFEDVDLTEEPLPEYTPPKKVAPFSPSRDLLQLSFFSFSFSFLISN